MPPAPASSVSASRKSARSVALGRAAALVGALAATAGIALVASTNAACGDPSHIYEGQLYRDDLDCLGTSSSVDVVEGDAPGTCAPVCLIQRTYDGGRAFYVSSMCGPYPFGFEPSSTDPICLRALSALARDGTCGKDSGPPETSDAATTPDATEDANANADAAADAADAG